MSGSTPFLSHIKIPTLVIGMAKAIPGARLLQSIPGAGHLVAFEQAEAFNERLRAWLAVSV